MVGSFVGLRPAAAATVEKVATNVAGVDVTAVADDVVVVVAAVTLLCPLYCREV